MSKVNRNEPKRSKASESQYSPMEYAREFPDDAACLEHLWRSRFSADGSDGSHAYCPKCKRERKFHRVASRPSWSCDSCGHHIHPTAGTIFHRSATRHPSNALHDQTHGSRLPEWRCPHPTIEGFFGNIKNGIAGNYHGVSVKWLQSYVNEYVWRYNHRDSGRSMFAMLLSRAANTKVDGPTATD